MGGVFSQRTPDPLPAPARPVTAVTKTPELELADDTEVTTEIGKKKKGKRVLRTDVKQETGQVPKAVAGLQIKKGS